MKIGDTLFTISGEIACVTRIEGWNVFGVFCTGPLVDSMNAAGQPNDFLLNLDVIEAARVRDANPTK